MSAVDLSELWLDMSSATWHIWRDTAYGIHSVNMFARPDASGIVVHPDTDGLIVVTRGGAIARIDVNGSSLLNVQRWTPSGLLVEAQKLMPSVIPSLLIPIAVTALLIVFMMVLTLSKLRHLECNVRATQ